MARDTAKSTKELILDSAFSFYENPVFRDFSMRELAAKVGVSKPAIYHHFTNKEAVVAAMEERVFDTMALYLQNVSDDIQTSKLPLARLINYFVQNPSYINYLIAQFSSNKSYERRIFDALFSRNVLFSTGYSSIENYEKTIAEHPDCFVKQSYVGASIFFFVKVTEILLRRGDISVVPETYVQRLVDFLVSGLLHSTKSGDFFYPSAISDGRKAALQNLCAIGENMLPEENRIFVAFANVIRKFKPSGVTVERIANELNMAKSSLYEYFANKNEMIRQLVDNEIALLQTIISENSVEAQNFTEYMFIMIWTIFEYFSKRPAVIPICGWLLMMNDSSLAESEKKYKSGDVRGGLDNRWAQRIPERVERPDLGVPFSARILVHWLGCLPIALLIQSAGKGWSDEKQREGISILLDFIVNGIKNT